MYIYEVCVHARVYACAKELPFCGPTSRLPVPPSHRLRNPPSLMCCFLAMGPRVCSPGVVWSWKRLFFHISPQEELDLVLTQHTLVRTSRCLHLSTSGAQIPNGKLQKHLIMRNVS